MTTIYDRKGRILIVWCPDDKLWFPPEEIGGRCPCHPCVRTLRKRRAYRCGDTCDEDMVCFTRAALDEHRREYHGVGIL